MRGFPSQRHHARRVLFLLLIPLLMQPGGTLHRQRMHGQAVRAQFADHVKRVRKHPVVLARQRGDHIHVDIVKAQFPGKMITVNRLLRGMRASNDAKRLVVHGLRVNTDARHRMAAQHGQLLAIQCVRPAGLHRQFMQRAEAALHVVKQTVKLRGGQAAGRAAADIADADVQPHVADHIAAQIDLAKQRGKIRLDQFAIADLA